MLFDWRLVIMERKYTIWFNDTRNFIIQCVKNEEITDKILQYEIFDYVHSSFMLNNGYVQIEDIKEVVEAVLNSLCNKSIFKAELWDEYLSKTEHYTDFMKQYQLSHVMTENKIGSFWIEYINDLDMKKDESKRISFLEGLKPYYLWTSEYCMIFSWQYWIENYRTVPFYFDKIYPMQYWERKEIENHLNVIQDLSLEEQLKELIDYKDEIKYQNMFLDRESLCFEIIKRGVSIRDTIKIVEEVRKARYLTDEMIQVLKIAEVEEELINWLDLGRYIPTQKTSVVRMLSVTKLI